MIFLILFSASLTEVRIGKFQDTTAKFVSIYPEVEGIDTIETLLFNLTNEERIKNGLGILKLDKRLKLAAREHSKDMVKRKYLSHNSPDEINKTPLHRIYNSGLPVLLIGENVAENIGGAVPLLLQENPDSLAKLIMSGWMDSPNHRKNILNPEFTHMGIGCVGRGEVLKATQNFANLSDFGVDSVIVQVRSERYKIFFYVNSFLPEVWAFDNGKLVSKDSLEIKGGKIIFSLLRDRTLHKLELCLKDQNFYRCGVRLFVYTGSPCREIFQLPRYE
ncbi:MAG: CAP domain-containing protein [candidate division WOR-3 bacterium]